MASWVRLCDEQTNREFLVLNTHWDHISEDARRKSAGLIRDRLATLAECIPAVVMGDLNGPEDSPEVIALLGAGKSSRRRLSDSYRKLYPKRAADEATFGGWTGATTGSRIDFILHSDGFRPTAAAIHRTSYEGRWPSDHYPVTATLRFEQ
jgi:endonuclease/exonuclease/phosphatase family metal-dependent hydrolase